MVVGEAQRSSECYSRWLLVLVVLLLACDLTLAQAQDERVTARVDGAAVLRVGPLGEIDATPRAQRIETRIGALLQTPQTITPAVIDPPVSDAPKIPVIA